ncbi:hypothetical protein M5K25_023200 [Dendrobium thyrsiflorum]|uniref:Uncharacterized protein n=1 Tax=Dendrobium thyrsiflorum TaxID=117978 RepID=A0ABD0U7G6_DENTH
MRMRSYGVRPKSFITCFTNVVQKVMMVACPIKPCESASKSCGSIFECCAAQVSVIDSSSNATMPNLERCDSKLSVVSPDKLCSIEGWERSITSSHCLLRADFWEAAPDVTAMLICLPSALLSCGLGLQTCLSFCWALSAADSWTRDLSVTPRCASCKFCLNFPRVTRGGNSLDGEHSLLVPGLAVWMVGLVATADLATQRSSFSSAFLMAFLQMRRPQHHSFQARRTQSAEWKEKPSPAESPEICGLQKSVPGLRPILILYGGSFNRLSSEMCEQMSFEYSVTLFGNLEFRWEDLGVCESRATRKNLDSYPSASNWFSYESAVQSRVRGVVWWEMRAREDGFHVVTVIVVIAVALICAHENENFADRRPQSIWVSILAVSVAPDASALSVSQTEVVSAILADQLVLLPIIINVPFIHLKLSSPCPMESAELLCFSRALEEKTRSKMGPLYRIIRTAPATVRRVPITFAWPLLLLMSNFSALINFEKNLETKFKFMYCKVKGRSPLKPECERNNDSRSNNITIYNEHKLVHPILESCH